MINGPTSRVSNFLPYSRSQCLQLMYSDFNLSPDDSRGGPHSLLSQEEFHSNLRSNVTGLSNSCTKLSLLFCSPSSPPSLNETGTICSKVENATLGLTSTYYQCKTEWGKPEAASLILLSLSLFLQVNVIIKMLRDLSSIFLKESQVSVIY